MESLPRQPAADLGGDASLAVDGDLGPGPRTKLRRMAGRGRYDRATVYGILDEGVVCHLGLVVEGRPVVVPTVYGRLGDAVYLHGAPANGALGSAADNGQACLTVSLLDALVLARSAFHQSVNYRSVMAFGTTEQVVAGDEKRRALMAIVEHVVPGRGGDVRPPSEAELRATRVLRFEILEASAKIRSGGPTEEPEDLALTGVWAGQVPVRAALGSPLVDTQGPVQAPFPAYMSTWSRARAWP
jgi:uncharacterized protein